MQWFIRMIYLQLSSRFRRGLFANEAPDSSIHSNDRTCSTVAYENESRPSVEAIHSISRIGISQLFTGEEVEPAAGVTRRAIPMWRSERVREWWGRVRYQDLRVPQEAAPQLAANVARKPRHRGRLTPGTAAVTFIMKTTERVHFHFSEFEGWH